MSDVRSSLASWVAGRSSRDPLPRGSADEPLRGWRAWQVIESKQGPTLASWWLGTLWPVRRELQAACFMHGPRPAAHHVCGIHAFDAREDALAYIAARRDGPMPFRRTPSQALAIAVGCVSGWGRVVRHTRGWRSQYAYPFDVHLLTGDSTLARLLADRYAVDVTSGLWWRG